MAGNFELFCELVTNLRSGNARLRGEAIYGIGRIADPSCTNLLLEAIKGEKDNRIRSGLLKILGRIGSANLIPVIAPYLKDPDPRVRSNSIESLGQMGGCKAEVIHLIAPLIDDSDSRVTCTAAKVLAEFDDPRGLDTLNALLMGDDNHRRCSAIWAMGALRHQPSLNVLIGYLGSTVYRVHSIAGRAVRMFGVDAVAPLIDALGKANPSRRAFIVVALGQIGDHRAVGPLIELLKSETSTLVAWTIGALAGCKGIEAIPDIIKFLKHPEPDVRVEVLKSCRVLRATTEVPLIQAHLASEADRRVISTALTALGEFGGPEVVETLRSYLNSDDSRIRANAIEAIGHFGDRLIIGEIVPLLEDKSGRVMANAAIVLSQFGEIDVLNVLKDRLRTGDEKVRLSVAYALGQIPLDGVVKPLVEAIRDESLRVRNMAVESLLRLRQSSNLAVTSAVTSQMKESPGFLNESGMGRLVGDLNIKEALGPLLNFVRSPIPAVPLPASRGIEALIGHLVNELKTHSIELKDLVKSGDPGVLNSLRELLGAEEANLRCFGLHAVGELGLKDTLGSVVCLLADENPVVRRQALLCVGSLGDRRALPFLWDRLVEEDPSLQGLLLGLLSRFGDPSTLAFMENERDRFLPHLAEQFDQAMADIRSRASNPGKPR